MGAIEGVSVTPLKIIQVPAGDIFHAITNSDFGFFGFGEAYFSIVELDAIKAWKRHLRMTLNIVVPLGTVQFAFFDAKGKMREEVVGGNRYVRLTVPPGIWFGFKGLFSPYSTLMNVADIPHDPKEVERKTINEIKFNWKIK